MNTLSRRLTWCCMVFALVWAHAAAAQSLPPNFIEDIIASDLTYPVAFTRLPDGRILIAQKSGVVRLVKNGVLQPTPFIDLTSKVNDYWDRGMLGIAVDPSFATNGFIYLFYVFESNANDYSGPKTSRLVRVTAVGDTASPASEVVLLGTQSGPSCGGFPVGADCIPADSPSHNGGTLRFASDGTLFLSTGDAASFTVVDDLALRAQDIRSLAGKILHITKTGAGISTNPFWTGSASDIRSKVWAYGVRNPFRFNLQPGTNQVFVGDVGWSTYEEINAAVRGANLGWPCYEGNGQQPGYVGYATCQTLYASGPSAVQMPVTFYSHDNVSAAVVGGPFYNGTSYPTQYRGALFFGDYARGWIQYLMVDSSNNLVSGPSTFGSDLPGPVDIQMLPDEQLYYVAINTGELRRIRYVGTAETRYASDVNWLSATNGWGPVEKDKSNGESAPGDGRTLTINGVTYVKGLGVHAYSEIRYQLDGICSSFSAVVGVDDEVGSNGSVVFQIFGDGTQLYTSGLLTGTSAGVPVSIPLFGIKQLTLIVNDGGDGNASDHADWADAKLTCGGSAGTLFAAPVSLAARTNMHSVSAVDLNLDGKLDLVAASSGASVASVWLGNGNLTFGARTDFPTGLTPKSISVADVNRDGKPDLISANQDAASVSVLIGNGAGGFAAPVNYPVCTGTHETAVADFTGDGAPDVMVACWGGSVVTFLKNNGNGTFAAGVNYAAGAAPTSIVAGDFNGDGRPDVAVANHDEGTVSVLTVTSTGTFNPQVKYTVGSGPHSIRARDIDGDGVLDLAVANEFSNTISVLRGRAGGTFDPAVNYPTGSVPKGVGIADVDGDGRPDLLSANTAGNYPTCCNPGGDTISVLLNAGGGSFAAAQTYQTGTTPFAVTAADLDGDGDLDVVTANWHSNDVTILRNANTVDPPPQLSNISVGNIGNTSAVVTWTTNEPADTQVEYGPDPRYGFSSPLNSTPTTTHQVSLSGLTASTLYHYRVKSRDSAGNLSVSGDFTFTTTGGTVPVVYLSDLTWLSMTNGWGPAEKDRSNGEVGTADGAAITLNGVTYTRGLGVHANSEIVYAIPSGCNQFFTAIGLDDEIAANGSVQFQVWADATLLYQSGVLTGNSATVAVALTLAGQSQLRLVVTDAGDGNAYDHADWANARFLCGAVNNPPVPTISAPASGTLFKVGDVINYSGSATDTEDGTVAASSLEWIITLYHCPGSTCHTHPFQHSVGASGSFTAPDHGDNSYFEITLWATDTGGATATATRIVNPRTSQVTLNTVPAGLQVAYGGVGGAAPLTSTSIVGSAQTISVPSPQGNLVFQSWSDGGAQQHNITVGATNMTLTATFGTSGPVSTTSYLSDLTWTSMTNGYGPVEKDKSNGENLAGDGHTITLNGVTFAKGLGAHALSDVRYAVNGTCSTFAATVGVDDEVGSSGSVVFQVLGDGVVLYDSGPMTGTTASKNVSVTIGGRSVLTLLVNDAGDGIASDHGDWADARVTCTSSGSTTTYLSDRTWTSMTNGYGPVEKDTSNGENLAGDGHTITLNGLAYPKGLGTHAFSDVRYTLNGTCSTFAATVGVDDEVGAGGSVVFQVLGDGALLYDSGTMTGTSASKDVSLTITGRNVLTLLVNDAGDGIASDHADWANARVTCTSSSAQAAPAVDPATGIMSEPVTPALALLASPDDASVFNPPLMVFDESRRRRHFGHRRYAPRA